MARREDILREGWNKHLQSQVNLLNFINKKINNCEQHSFTPTSVLCFIIDDINKRSQTVTNCNKVSLANQSMRNNRDLNQVKAVTYCWKLFYVLKTAKHFVQPSDLSLDQFFLLHFQTMILKFLLLATRICSFFSWIWKLWYCLTSCHPIKN